MSSTKIQTKTRRFLPMLLAMLLLLITWTTMPAFSQENTGISRTQWQMIRSDKPVQTDKDTLKTSKVFSHPSMVIPDGDDPDWKRAPLDPETQSIRFNFKSREEVGCGQNLDFTYFQTTVTIPSGYVISKSEVKIAQVDDYARVYIFNSAHPTGVFNPATDLLPPAGKNGATMDISKFISSGENRVVIVQVDHCSPGNNLIDAQVYFEGSDSSGNSITEYVPVAANAFYVDKDATGKATGLSWTDAFTNVQDALAKAKSGNEIWVAEGVYYPDVGGGKTDNDKSASFTIPSGVVLYGGFVATETILEERNWQQYVTVLSGDIDQNDTTKDDGVVASSSNISGTNSLHVVYLDGTTNPITGTTRIDGFVITAGQANDDSSPNNMGGGLLCFGNTLGGECSPTVMNVTFSGNAAIENGGAMINLGGYEGKSSPTMMNVTFSGNAARYGGALYNFGGGKGNSSPMLTNVVFRGNAAQEWGGAIFNQGVEGISSPSLVNVTFSGNSAEKEGGAIYNYGTRGTSSPTLTNVILWNNSAAQGPSIYNLDDATATIQHSIVENGVESIAGTNTNSVTYDNSTNMDSDPLFTDDLQLQEGSPAIDKGDNSPVSAVITDLFGNDRIIGSAVDLGAYEFLEAGAATATPTP